MPDHTRVVAERFGRLATNYRASEVHRSSPSVDRLATILAEHSTSVAGCIVDIGCGPGATGRALGRLGAGVIGVDCSRDMLEIAAEDAKRMGMQFAAVTAVAECLPIQEHAAAVTVSRLALHHVPETHAAVQEMRRVTRPGGFVAVIDLVAPDRERLEAINHEIELLHDPTHHRTQTFRWWLDAFERAGVDIVAAEARCDERPEGITVDRWCEIANSPAGARDRIVRMLEEMNVSDREALGWRTREGLHFCSVRTMLLCGRRRSPSQHG